MPKFQSPVYDAVSDHTFGRHLTARKVKLLEARLQETPDDLQARRLLIGFYDYGHHDTDQKATSLARHLAWLIEHHPTDGIHPIIYILKKKCATMVRDSWLKAVDQDPTNTLILRYAADQCGYALPKDSEKFLRKAIELDPDNEEIHRELSHFCFVHAQEPSSRSDRSYAKKAIESGRKALEIHRQQPRESYLEQYMVMTVHDLAGRAIKFGLLDDALWLSNYLTEFEPVPSEDSRVSAEWKRERARRTADILRGRVSLAQGNVQEACDCLRRMQASQPDRISIELADELLAARQRDVVIAYLEASVNNLKGKLDDFAKAMHLVASNIDGREDPNAALRRTVEDFENLIVALRKGSKKRPSLHIHWH